MVGDNGKARREPAARVQELVARFRRDSLAVRLPLRERLLYWTYYVALARRGVMVHSAERDAVYADGFYKRGYDKYCERLNRRLAERRASSAYVDVPSFEHGELGAPDFALLMRTHTPFVLRGGARDLRAHDWTLEYLEEVVGDAPVPINAADDRPEADQSRPSKAHRYYDFKTGTLGEVAASIRAGGNMRVTTAEDVMHHAGGRLRDDLDLPYWERVAGWEENQHHWLRSRMLAGKVFGAQLMLQPEHAFTLWHAEPGDNFFVLARGRKTWTLAHPYYTAAMRPRVKTTTNYHGSNIDAREPDDVLLARGFDGYLGVPKVRVDLEPGDVLRVPNHWWHTATTHAGDYAIAATIRLGNVPNLVGPGYMVLRWLDTQFHEMARAFTAEGRITDRHIGYPRKSRTLTPEPPPREGGSAAAREPSARVRS